MYKQVNVILKNYKQIMSTFLFLFPLLTYCSTEKQFGAYCA